MGFYIDIPKPKAWPPPLLGDSQRVRALLEYGAKRDPVGDKIHTAFACLFMFALPISTYSASLSMWVVCAYSLIRLPSTWRTVVPLLRSSVFWSILVWGAWSLLSMIWTSELDMAQGHARSIRMVAIPIVLIPVARRWPLFIIFLLLGVALQNLTQLSEVVGSWFMNGHDWKTGSPLFRPAGWDKHQGNAAMFMGFAVIIWLGIYISKKSIARWAVAGLLLALFGTVIAKSMAVGLGLFIALIMLFWWVLSRKHLSRKQFITILSTMLLCVFVVGIFGGESIQSRLQVTFEDSQKYSEGTVSENSSTQYRLHWWRTTLDHVFDEPVILHALVGHGLGNTRAIDFSKEGSTISPVAGHPHNTFIQILYEGGIVGLAIFLWMLLKIFGGVKQVSNKLGSVAYPVCASLVVLWSVAAFFESSQNSGRPLALLVLVGTFVLFYNVTVQETRE